MEGIGYVLDPYFIDDPDTDHIPVVVDSRSVLHTGRLGPKERPPGA